ncbi:MAG: hypothetical protein ABI197_04935 [Granulicella sp.]
MSDQIPPQQPPFTNVPYSEVPNAGPVVPPQQPGYPPQQAGYPPQQPGYPPPQQPGYLPPAGYPPQGAYPPQAAAPSTGMSENSAAALSYVTIIPAIIFLVLEPYNKMPLVRFHSIQCLLLAGVSVILQIGLTILSIFLHFIPMLGIVVTALFSILHLVVFVGIFIAWLMAIIKASKGEWYKLPIIGDQALKMARGQ